MEGTSPDTMPDVGATGIGRFRFFVSTLPAGGRQATSLFKGTDGPPTSRSIRPAQGEFGMAYRARAPWPRSVRSSRRSHDRPGRAGKPSTFGRRDTGVNRSTGTVRYARCGDAKAVLETIHDTGEPSAVNAARSVREGVVGKGPGNRNLAGDLLHGTSGLGRGRRKRTHTAGTSSATYFTSRTVVCPATDYVEGVVGWRGFAWHQAVSAVTRST